MQYSLRRILKISGIFGQIKINILEKKLIQKIIFFLRIQLAKEEKERIEQAKAELAAKVLKDIHEQELRTGLLTASCQKIDGILLAIQ